MNNSFAQDCSQRFTKFIPINDLGTDTFNGFTRGKYPGGSNSILLLHYKKGMENSQRIKPLTENGEHDAVNGTIGFMVLGFNTAAMTAVQHTIIV